MSSPGLAEAFDQPALDARWRWHGAPRLWSFGARERRLRIEPDAGTDFWQRTHYGFSADNGHFLGAEFVGDFVLTTTVESIPHNQYDQAGLMVRTGPRCWLKCSVEFELEGPSHLGVVVTNAGYSDWSMQPVVYPVKPVQFRVRREGDDYAVDYAAGPGNWEPLRITHLHEAAGRPVTCGLYACSPKGAGFVASFLRLSLQPGRVGGS